MQVRGLLITALPPDPVGWLRFYAVSAAPGNRRPYRDPTVVQLVSISSVIIPSFIGLSLGKTVSGLGGSRTQSKNALPYLLSDDGKTNSRVLHCGSKIFQDFKRFRISRRGMVLSLRRFSVSFQKGALVWRITVS